MERKASGVLVATGAVRAVRTAALRWEGLAWRETPGGFEARARFRETVSGRVRAFRFEARATRDGLRLDAEREIPPAFPARPVAEAPPALRALLERWRRAWNRRDGEALAALYRDPAAAPRARWRADWKRAPREELFADRLIYDPARRTVRAHGHVRLRTDHGEGRAARIELRLGSGRAEAEAAEWRLPDGRRLRARRLVRASPDELRAEGLVFTRCPPEAEAWRVRAARGTLDLAAGWFTARNARLELGPAPVLWTPWWRQAVRRHSGLLAPVLASDRQRGTVFGLPLYWAPRADWDATLTPAWLSRRGLLANLEVRHAAPWGRLRLEGEGLRDRAAGRTRSRWAGELTGRLGTRTTFSAHGEGASDARYLAELAPARAQTPYLVREATAAHAFPDGEARLRVQALQNLARPDLQGATLAVLPELALAWTPQPAPGLTVELAPRITRFARRRGLRGLRGNLHAALRFRREWLPGGLAAGGAIGVEAVGWRLRDRAPVRASLAAPFVRLWGRAAWARRFDALRHEVGLRVVLHAAQAPEQTGRPLLDASLPPYGWASLDATNRFAGGDRIERARRLSLVHTQKWQVRTEAGVREVAALTLGAGYRWREPVTDRRLEPRRFATGWEPLLARLVLAPGAGLRLTGEGLWDLRARRRLRSEAALDWSGAAGGLSLRYWETQPAFGAAARSVQARAHWRGARLRAEAAGDYDARRRRWLRATGELAWLHPCWELSLSAFAERGLGATPGNRGVRLLLTLAGLGSLGAR